MNVIHDDYTNHISGDPRLGLPSTIGLGIFNASLIISNLFLLNKCIQYFEPIYIIPMKKVALLINNILCGGLILKEFREYNLYMAAGIASGIILCAIGVSFFIFKRKVSLKKSVTSEKAGLKPTVPISTDVAAKTKDPEL